MPLYGGPEKSDVCKIVGLRWLLKRDAELEQRQSLADLSDQTNPNPAAKIGFFRQEDGQLHP